MSGALPPCTFHGIVFRHWTNLPLLPDRMAQSVTGLAVVHLLAGDFFLQNQIQANEGCHGLLSSGSRDSFSSDIKVSDVYRALLALSLFIFMVCC